MSMHLSQQRLADTRAAAHARCVVCGSRDGAGSRVRFTATDDGGVSASFVVGESYEGYPGILHGGVIATLLDAAMTNCLFAQGRRGLTADLHVRYRHPVHSGQPCFLRAWIESATAPLYVLRAELRQGELLRATAVAKFLARSEDVS
jgi:acyl-coenzyme A thioesterase PaaI-like protein